MPTILERLREALRPEYEVERELASGGMGTVFLARDVNLDRSVAIKIIRPELATARAAERFLREARILANLSHPNVVPVHRAGEAGGFSYYVMDYVRGATLKDRLEQGPLKPDEARKLGRDILDALEAVHRLGVVHRDIKPSNIFLIRGRALLADFGIARPSDPAQITERMRGTPGYMPPEQAFGLDVSPQTDLYATAMVLYEAFTGRRWQAMLKLGDQDRDWSGIPRPLVSILRRALSWEPHDRWPDARQFRHALWKTRTRRYRQRTFLLTVAGLVVGTSVTYFVLRAEGAALAELAVLPFDPEGEADSSLGVDLANLVELNITALDLTARAQTFRIYDSARAERRQFGADMFDRLRTRTYTRGTVAQQGDSLSIRVSVFMPGDTVTVPIAGRASDLAGVGCQIALEVVRVINQPRLSQNRCNQALVGKKSEAFSAFLAGERAFRQNNWQTALERYAAALTSDTTFVLAALRFTTAWGWLLSGEAATAVDLEKLYAEHGDNLFELDRLILEALLADGDRRRFAIYQSAVEKYPRDGYIALLYADALFHRAPYLGIPLDTAARWLEDAVEKDSSFSPSLHHLAWVWIRLGNREQAWRALERFKKVAGPPEEVSYLPQIFELAFVERFAPERVAVARESLFVNPELAAQLQRSLRLAPTLDLSRSQTELARILAADPRIGRAELADALEAQALGLIALGQIADALMLVDSATALFDTPEARIQAAEWRVVAPITGLPGVLDAELEVGRRMLERMAADPALEQRAAWALALDATERGDTVTARGWRNVVRGAQPDTTAARLGALLDAAYHGARGQYELAVSLSTPLLAHDSAGPGVDRDPFERAVLHMKLADWLDSLGRPAAADSVRLWYQHSDYGIVPTAEALGAEVDWALGTYAEWLRGESAFSQDDHRTACASLKRALRLWADADSAYAPHRTLAEAHARNACGR